MGTEGSKPPATPPKWHQDPGLRWAPPSPCSPPPLGAAANPPQGFGRRMEVLDRRRQQLGQRAEQLRDVALSFDAFLKVWAPPGSAPCPNVAASPLPPSLPPPGFSGQEGAGTGGMEGSRC